MLPFSMQPSRPNQPHPRKAAISARLRPIRNALLHYVRADYLDRRYEDFAGPAWEVVTSL